MNLEFLTNQTRAKKLISKQTSTKKLIAKPTTLHWDIISENLVSVRKQKPKIIVDRPIYLAFCILELSQITLSQFHYERGDYEQVWIACKNCLHSERLFYIPHSNATSIQRYGGQLGRVQYVWLSSRPHPPLKTNAKVLGKMKDECSSLAPEEFVGLRAKIYSILLPSA